MRKVIKSKYGAMVWCHENERYESSDVSSIQEAIDILKLHGRDVAKTLAASTDAARAFVEILWDTPLEDGQLYHKRIYAPVIFFLWDGEIKGRMYYERPSQLAKMREDWASLDGWWPKQYDKARNDKNTLIIYNNDTKSPYEKAVAKWGASHE